MNPLNPNSLNVGANGRVSFSGLASGINFKSAVDGIIKAKTIPVDLLKKNIKSNTTKITAYQDLRTLLDGLKSAVTNLYGSVSVGNATNSFQAKSAFASTSRLDGQAPSAAANLIGVTVTNAAALGTHNIQVLRIAAANKIMGGSVASPTTALNLSGSFTVNGQTIAVTAGDTLQDVRDRINSANTGVNASGVTASIVTVSSTQNFLVLTADKTGTNMTITDSGTVLSGLGLSSTNGTGGFRNGLSTGSKITTAAGLQNILFDGSQADKAFLISYDQATRVMTLTRADGTTDTATLSSTAIAAGATESASFSKFGATVVLDSNFNKATSITVAANTASVTGGTGVITPATVKISGSTGNISGITANNLTFGALATPAAITVTAGAFTGTFDGTTTGAKTVNLSDGAGNTLQVQFNVTTAFSGTETAGSITLNSLQNAVGATGTKFTNELVKAQSARLTADGLVDPKRFESNFISSRSATLGSYLTTALFPASFNITVGGSTVTVNNVLSTDTLDGLATKINSAITTAGAGNAVFDAGTNASVVPDGNGFRLVITDTNAAKITLGDTTGLLGKLGVDNKLVITRPSNNISDLFNGLTVSLFQAEEGTNIKVQIERDLSSVKTQINAFVKAYNAIKTFINKQDKTNPTTGRAASDAGVLFGSRTLATVEQQLSNIVGSGTLGVNSAYSVLAQVGVNFVDNNSLSDSSLKDTLTVDTTKLDSALVNHPNDVRKLFAFDFSSSDPRVSLLGFTKQTAYSAAGFKVNINFDQRSQSKAITDAATFTNVLARTGGLAQDGISAVNFGISVPTGQAFRYSYNGTTGDMTLVNTTTGATETVNVAASIDAVTGVGNDLAAGQTATISFSSLDAKITLSGTNGFKRATSISGGTLNTTALDPNTTITAATATTPTTAINKVTVDALNAAGAYAPASGLLTLGVTSTAAGEAHLDAAAGIKFKVDAGAIAAGPTANLADGAPHSVGLYVNNGTTDVLVGTVAFNAIASTAAGTGSMTVDLGTGLLGETSVATNKTSPMSNYLTFSNSSLEIRDASNTLLGTIAYKTTDSITDLANNINAAGIGVTANVIATGTTFQLDVTDANHNKLNFTDLGGGLLSQLNITDQGTNVFSANVNGTANGANNNSATVSGATFTATNQTTANGLKLFYSGNADLSNVQVNYTVGVAAQMFFAANSLSDTTSGAIEGEINTLTDQNKVSQGRIDSMTLRLNLERQRLTKQFIAAETALASLANIRNSLSQISASVFSSKN